MGQARRIVGVIQARMNSSRLPGKVMMPLAGAPMLQRLIERVRPARRLEALVVATTDTAADAPVAGLCAELGVACYRGDEANVLGRMLDAATNADAEIMVRLTADNPLVDATLVDLVIEAFLAADPPVAYAGNVEDSGFPFGLFVEVASMRALAQAAESDDPENREHVTWYIRRNPDRFPSLAVRATASFPIDALSVDTAADYERVRAIFEREYARNPDFTYQALTAAPKENEAAR